MHAILLAMSQAADTVVMRMVPPEASGFEKVLTVAEAGLVLLAYILLAGAVYAIVRLNKSIDKAKSSFDEMGRDVRELVDNANKISRSATAVAESIREDLDSVRETVEYANRRAHRAVSELADRVDEFNRGLGVVQRDTQNVVFSAIAAIKGVRAGVTALRRKRGKRVKSTAVDRDVELEAEIAPKPRLKRRAPAES